MSFFGELKRRNVFRVAAAYVAVAWLIIQVAETLFPVFGLSDAGIRLVVILLAIGFLPAVISAWAFELTPEGLKREAEVDHDSPANRRMTRRLDRLVLLILALALGLFAVDKFLLDPARDAEELATAREQAREEGRSEAQASARENSIAVLPFDDLSPGGDQAYFADGISVDLLNQLAGIPQVRVTGKTSSFAYRDREATIPEIGEALNVAHVLDGSVTKAGDRIRIYVELMDTRSDRQIWSQTYDLTLGDIFEVRDDISARVFGELAIEFERLEQKSLRTDPEAYDLTLQAWYLLDRMQSEDDFRQAADLVDRSMAIDPEYIPTLLASIYASYGLMQIGLITQEEEIRRSDERIEQILAVDPDNGTALGLLAWTDWETRLDLESAAKRFSRALRTAPGDLELTRYVGMFARSIGRHAEAIALLERCVAADPEDWRCTMHLALANLWGRQLDPALQTYRKMATLGRSGAPYYLTLTLLLQGQLEQAMEEVELLGSDFGQAPQGLAARAMILHDMGRHAESEASLKKLVAAIDENERDHAYLVAQAHAWAGRNDDAFEWLETALSRDQRYGQQGYWFLRILFLPVWQNLHDDPRWEQVRARANLSQARLDALEFTVPPWIEASLD
jgi:TolB-like protein/thioredoxin-like negative regulator of GroEL